MTNFLYPLLHYDSGIKKTQLTVQHFNVKIVLFVSFIMRARKKLWAFIAFPLKICQTNSLVHGVFIGIQTLYKQITIQRIVPQRM